MYISRWLHAYELSATAYRACLRAALRTLVCTDRLFVLTFPCTNLQVCCAADDAGTSYES